jgi:hypothetical protein
MLFYVIGFWMIAAVYIYDSVEKKIRSAHSSEQIRNKH